MNGPGNLDEKWRYVSLSYVHLGNWYSDLVLAIDAAGKGEQYIYVLS